MSSTSSGPTDRIWRYIKTCLFYVVTETDLNNANQLITATHRSVSSDRRRFFLKKQKHKKYVHPIRKHVHNERS